MLELLRIFSLVYNFPQTESNCHAISRFNQCPDKLNKIFTFLDWVKRDLDMSGDQYSKPFSPWRPGDAYSVENDLSDWRLLLGTVRDGDQLRSEQEHENIFYNNPLHKVLKFTKYSLSWDQHWHIVVKNEREREILENFCFDSPSMNNKLNNRETFF